MPELILDFGSVVYAPRISEPTSRKEISPNRLSASRHVPTKRFSRRDQLKVISPGCLPNVSVYEPVYSVLRNCLRTIFPQSGPDHSPAMSGGSTKAKKLARAIPKVAIMMRAPFVSRDHFAGGDASFL